MSFEAPDRFTIVIVPADGTGQIRQYSLSRRYLRWGLRVAATAVLLLAIGAGTSLWSLPRALTVAALKADNLRLRTQVKEVDARLRQLSDLASRLQGYDERLKDLETRGLLPGMGPLSAEEEQARQNWLHGTLPEPVGDENADLGRGIDQLDEKLEALDVEHLGNSLATAFGREGSLPQIWPVEGVITSGFGYRHSPFTGVWTMHGGIDIGVPYGDAILAANRGTVVFSGWDAGHGQMVVVDHGNGVVTRYCHASQLLVSEGDEVQTGEVVALVGSTGMSTGPHLHFDLILDGERVDPLDYLP